jgi:hypothetical protein
MEENQPIILGKGAKVQIFGKWLMEVQQDVVTKHWYLRSTTYDYDIYEIGPKIKTDFKKCTLLNIETIAKAYDGITEGLFLPEFATIESLMLFVYKINELYDNAKEKEKCGEPKENNQKDRPIVDKLMTATNEYRPATIPNMLKTRLPVVDFSSLYPVTPTGEFNIIYRGDSKSQNPLWWYLDILGERKKQQEKTNDSTITTTKKTKDYETELQDKGTSLSRGNLSEGHQLRSRKNKTRIVCGHLGDKTKDC